MEYIEENIVTVIIPNYNRENIIGRAISSVLNQTFPKFELIIVDDFSSDNSLEMINKFKDKRLKVYQLKSNSGAAAARNYGIKKAEGIYISLLDSDDYYDPEFLEKSIKAIHESSPGVGFSWTGVRYLENKKIKEFIWQPARKGSPYLTFLNSLHIGTNSGITFKRKIFKEVGYFNTSLPAAEDTDLFLRITQKFDYIIIPEVLINIERDNADRMSKNFKNIALAYNEFLPAHFQEIDKSSALQLKFYYRMMWLNYVINNTKAARMYYEKVPNVSIKTGLKPFLIKYLYETFPLELAIKFHKRITAR